MRIEKMFKAKRGQLTIFIILGLILLFSSAMLIYIKERVSERQSFEDLIGTAPMEVAPVKEYIERCMYEIGKDAITLIGENGGYIEINRSVVSIFPGEPTMSDGIEIMEGTNMVVPYWLHMSDSNDCHNNCNFDISLMPELKKETSNDLSIENQISWYVEDNLANCINNFISFKSVGLDVNGQGKMYADTVVSSKDVMIKLKYPISIKSGNTNTSMEYFVQRFNVDLYYMYTLARQIVLQERTNYFLEQSTANLLSIFGDRNGIIPPMAGGIDFSSGSGSKSWMLNDVKDHISNFLMPYTSNFKVTNTISQNKVIVNETEDAWNLSINKMNYLVDLGLDYYFPIDVQFMYFPNWNIYLEVTPNKGHLIKPDSSRSGFLSYIGLGMTKYDFNYDVSYPVMVMLSDDAAFSNEGFDFYFAMEANLRNNQALMAPNANKYTPKEIAPKPESEYLCDDDGKRTGNITVNIRDYKTNQSLPYVDVISTFSKIGCVEGTADINGTYVGKFQNGLGYMSLKINGYLDMDKFYMFGYNKTSTEEYYMYPEKEISVSFIKTTFTKKSNWKLYELEPMIIENATAENLMFTLERVKDAESQQTVKKLLFYDDDISKNVMDLYPGQYKVTIMYFNSEIFTMPPSGDMPEMNMSLITSIKLEEPKYYFNISPEMLYENDRLIVYVPVPDVYNDTPNSEEFMNLDIQDNFELSFEQLKPILTR